MNVGSVVALVTAVTALVTALGTFFSQLGHLAWHRQATKPTQPPVPPASVEPPKP